MTREEELEAIRKHLEAKGATRCPTAAVATTLGVDISEADREAHRLRGLDPAGDAWRSAKERGRCEAVSQYQAIIHGHNDSRCRAESRGLRAGRRVCQMHLRSETVKFISVPNEHVG